MPGLEMLNAVLEVHAQLYPAFFSLTGLEWINLSAT